MLKKSMLKKRGSQKKKDIQKAAAFLFREKGYYSTTLVEVGNAVDLLAPSLYRYFESKEELLRSIMLPCAEVGTELIEEVAGSAKSPTQKLKEAFHVHLRLMDDYYPDMLVVTTGDFSALNDDKSITGHLSELWKRYTGAWLSIIESYISENPALSDLNPKIVCFAALGMCNWMYKWYAKDGELSSSEIADQYFRIFAQNLAD